MTRAYTVRLILYINEKRAGKIETRLICTLTLLTPLVTPHETRVLSSAFAPCVFLKIPIVNMVKEKRKYGKQERKRSCNSLWKILVNRVVDVCLCHC